MDNVTLPEVIRRVESDGRLDALRFEPTIYAGKAQGVVAAHCLDLIASVHECSRATARVIYSTSWGAFQMMGFNLYDPNVCDYQKTVFAFVGSESDQDAALLAFLTRAKINFAPHDLLDPANRDRFAQGYNGAGNVAEYSARILAACNALGVS